MQRKFYTITIITIGISKYRVAQDLLIGGQSKNGKR
jgi:hypothetical protein